MSERIRFHLDEHVDPAVARGLRSHGIDVTTTVGTGLRTSADEAQLAFAVSEGRVLVTHDAGFLRMASAGARHTGIAYCHRTARTIGEMIRTLILMHEVVAAEEIVDRVEFL